MLNIPSSPPFGKTMKRAGVPMSVPESIRPSFVSFIFIVLIVANTKSFFVGKKRDPLARVSSTKNARN